MISIQALRDQNFASAGGRREELAQCYQPEKRMLERQRAIPGIGRSLALPRPAAPLNLVGPAHG